MDYDAEIGIRVRQVRDALGFSQDFAAAFAGPEGRTGRWLSNVESGKASLSAADARRIAAGIGVDVEVLLGLAPLPKNLAQASQRGPVKRREFLKRGASGLIGVAATAALGPSAGGDWLTTGRRDVAPDDVDAIKRLIDTFRLLDNRFGGGYAYDLVTGHLDGKVLPMVRARQYNQAVGRHLCATSAQLAHLAGWMAYDLGDPARGRHYLDLASQMATAGGDHAFGGEVLAGISHQNLHNLNDPDEAIMLAQAAQQTAGIAGSQLLLAEGHVMEAHGHARRDDERACASSLHEAEIAFDQADRESEPEWLRYFDEAYLAAKMSHCFRELRQWDRAAHYAKRSLNMDDRFVRGRTFNVTLLATTYVETDLDEALSTGREAVELASGLQSLRTRRYIAELQERLTPRSEDPKVREFNEFVAERLRGV
jgi:transcriptional regulator with XRE-family HTH domain